MFFFLMEDNNFYHTFSDTKRLFRFVIAKVMKELYRRDCRVTRLARSSQ